MQNWQEDFDDLNLYQSPPIASTSSLSNVLPPAPASTKPPQPRRRPCHPCRLRKVACQWPASDPNANECTKCVAKGIHCAPMPPKAKRRPVNRSGPLIQAAKDLFGEPAKPSLKPSTTVSIAVAGTSLAQPSSISARLSSSELKGSLIANLLDFYLEFTKTYPTFFEETNIRAKFEAAGRRIHQLPDQTQVLLAAMAAAAARSSDHPLLIGDCPHKFAELKDLALKGTDLSEYGRRREAAVSALTDHAVRLADEKRTLRVANLESISSLMLIEGLQQTWDFSNAPQMAWTTSYLGHAKRLLEDPNSQGSMSTSIVAWTAFMRDVIVSSKMGRPSTFTEDDIYLMWGGRILPPIKNLLAMPYTLDPAVEFTNLFDSWMSTIALIAIRMSRQLTGPIARKAPKLDEHFVLEILGHLDDAKSAVPELGRRAALTEADHKYKYDEGPNFFGKNFVTLSLTRCCQCFILHDVVSKRASSAFPDCFDGAAIVTESNWTSSSIDVEYLQRLLVLRNETHKRAFEAAREVAHMLEQLLREGRALGGDWTDPRSLELLFADPPTWVNVLLEQRTVEEGGEYADYTFDAKLHDLEWILKALWSVSWAFEKPGRAIPWFEAEFHQQQAKRQAFWQTVMAGSYPFHLDQTPWEDLVSVDDLAGGDRGDLFSKYMVDSAVHYVERTEGADY